MGVSEQGKKVWRIMSVLNMETFKRIASALAALPLLAYVLITDDFQYTPILAGSIVISLGTLYEFYMISDRGENGRAFVKTGLFFGLVINLVMYIYAFGKMFGYTRYFGEIDARIILCVISVFMVVILAMQLFTRPLKGGTYSIAVTAFGVLYIVLSISHLILLRSLQDGAFYIIILIVVVMINDTGAYFGGVLFGRHKANIAASPNKSWEGYFTGLLFSIVGFVLVSEIFASFFSRGLFTMLESVILGICLSVLANIGDLVESAAKRDGGFKDSGSIIPGHGGMWDVFDAVMFALPVFYYYLVFKGIP